MGKKKTPLGLGRREQQIVDTVNRLGEASVADVRQHLLDPPSYSAVRAMLTILVEKKVLRFRQDGKRYLYRPASHPTTSRKHAITRVVETFFSGSPSQALAALLDASSDQLNEEEIQKMADLIQQTKKGNSQ